MLAIVVNTLIDERDQNITPPDDVSLRDAILEAQDGETITFDASVAGMNGGTITLLANLGEIIFGKNLTIDASMLPNGITIEGADPDDHLPIEEQVRGNGIRIFNITDPTFGSSPPLVTMIGLTLTGADPAFAFAGVQGGAIRSAGMLELHNMVIRDNQADYGAAVYVAVAGAATAERTVLDIQNSQIEHNSAVADGGGVYIYFPRDVWRTRQGVDRWLSSLAQCHRKLRQWRRVGHCFC